MKRHSRPTCALRRAFSEQLERRLLLFGGDLDNSFSFDGSANVQPLQFDNTNAIDVVVQSTGKVVVAGNSFNENGNGSGALVRYNVDGSLDTTFATNGLQILEFKEIDSFISAINTTGIAVQSDDKIVWCGWASRGSAPFTYGLVARFNADGTLDSTFGTGGKRSIVTFTNDVIDSLGNKLADVQIQPDGKIVLAGSMVPNSSNIHNSIMAAARLMPDGSFDNSFSDDGRRTLDVGGYAVSDVEALSPDGKIYIVGDRLTPNLPQTSVVRLNSNGGLDSSFDGDGIISGSFGSSYAWSKPNGAVVQPSGKLVMSGDLRSAAINDARTGILRLNLNGSVDTTFGSSGLTLVDLNNDNVADQPGTLIIGKAGKLLFGGLVGSAGHTQTIVGCLSEDGVFDTHFGVNGFMNAAGGSANGMALAPGNKVIVAGGAKLQATRFFDRSAVSISIGTFNVVMTEGSGTSVGLIVARLERLDTPTTVNFNIGGTAIKPYTGSGPIPADYTSTDLGYGPYGKASATVIIPAGQTFTTVYLTPVNDREAEIDETAIFTVTNSDTYDVFPPTSITFLLRDNDIDVGPNVISRTFDYEHVPNVVRFKFDQGVGTSLTNSDWQITGLPAGISYSTAVDQNTNTATISFSTPTLPNGNYSVTLPAHAVANTRPQMPTNPSASTLSFFSLAGDANHDRTVNFDDLIVLAQNFNGDANRLWSDGDFNDDGVVNFDDLIILAQNYNVTVPPPTAIASSLLQTQGTKSRKTRDSDLFGPFLVVDA